MTDIRIVSGDPSPEELAVVIALAAATSSTEETSESPPRGRWNDPARMHRDRQTPGPAGWRAAAR